MTLRIRARAGEAIPAGETVVIENGKVMIDRTPKIVRPLKASYKGYGLYSRKGELWDADVNRANLVDFKETLEDDEHDPNGPFRIVPVTITPARRDTAKVEPLKKARR